MWWIAVAALASDLTLVDDPRLVEDSAVNRQGISWALDAGFAFPVSAEDGASAGLVFVGRGTHSFSFAERGEAVRLANLLAADGPEAALDIAVSDGIWHEPFDVALFLSSDPQLPALLDTLKPVAKARGGVYYKDTDGQENIVVTDLRLDHARTLARRVLGERVERLQGAGLDPLDALHHDSHDDGPPRWTAEVRTDRVWLPFIEPAFQTGHERWLSFAEDATGLVDDTYARIVFVHGIGEGETARLSVVTGEPHEVRPSGAHVVKGTANAVFHKVATGVTARLEVEALIRVEADQETALVPLAIPHRRSGPYYGTPPQADGFEVVSITLADGTPVAVHDGIFGRPGLSHDPELVMLVLPEPISAGTTTTLRVITRDQWTIDEDLEIKPWAAKELYKRGACPSVLKCSLLVARLPEWADLGKVAEPRAMLPVVAGQGDAYPVKMRVGKTFGPAWVAVPGGGRVEELPGAGDLWVVTKTRSDAGLALGKLSSNSRPPASGMPAVDVLTWSPFAGGSPEHIRAVLHFFTDLLPPYPYPAVQIIQGRARAVLNVGGMGGREPTELEAQRLVDWTPGQLFIRGTLELNMDLTGLDLAVGRRPLNHRPYAIEGGLAHGLAAHWWTRPYKNRDAWIGAVMPVVYRDLYLEAAYPPKVARRWRLDAVREEGKERQPPRPLMGPAETETEERGARLFGGALRAQIGDRAFLAGLDRFLSGDTLTTEALRTELERASGLDLQGFFDVWVYTGVEPSVELRWDTEGSRLVGTVTSDLPYGTWSLPIQVRIGAGRQLVWVDMDRGTGVLDVPLHGEVEGVEVDPDMWLPLHRRRAHRDTRAAELESPEERGTTTFAPEAPRAM